MGHADRVSNHWKFVRRVFQSLELFLSIALLHALSLSVRADSVLNDSDLGHIDQALTYLNMSEADLSFAKDVGEPRTAIPWIREALREPLLLAERAAGIRAAATNPTPANLTSLCASLLDWKEADPVSDRNGEDKSLWDGLDPKLADALYRFMSGARLANELLGKAFASLTPEDKQLLAAAWYGSLFDTATDKAAVQAMEDAGILEAAIAKARTEAEALDPEPATVAYLDAWAKVDRSALLQAARVFSETVLKLRDAALEITAWPDGNIVVVTDLGKVRISTSNVETFSDASLLILSSNGRTTYNGVSGVANELNRQPLSAIIDLGGDDTYVSDDLLGAGSALFGISVLVDQAGHDTYRATYCGQASAFCGAAWSFDVAGHDVRRAATFGQSAATFGLAVLHDAAGNDTYDIGLQGQASSGVDALALLIDDAGQDRYSAGGREPDHERNDLRFLSLSQGFSIGIRPFAGGGVAALVDRGGNDNYIADVYGQGVSYWYAAGFLLDDSGHDTYSLHQYGQGSGIHLSLGLLWDGSGDDTYSGSILAQGNAHDYAVGMLIDREGNDTYTASEHSQGRAMNNALGLLLDGAGSDVYSARNNDVCQGIGNTGGHRDYGSLALLLDLDGEDSYSSGKVHGDHRLRPDYGVIYDVKVEEKKSEASDAP